MRKRCLFAYKLSIAATGYAPLPEVPPRHRDMAHIASYSLLPGALLAPVPDRHTHLWHPQDPAQVSSLRVPGHHPQCHWQKLKPHGRWIGVIEVHLHFKYVLLTHRYKRHFAEAQCRPFNATPETLTVRELSAKGKILVTTL